jgi:O-antigen/teichoic acid export membrane protein
MTILIVSDIGIAVPRFRNLREYLSFGLPTVPGNLSSWVINSSDNYLIGILLGIAYVGYYAPGYALGNIVTMFIAPLAFMLPAILSKHYDENNVTELQTVLKYSMKYYLILTIPSVIGLSLLSKPILMIVTTPEIAEAGYLITPFVALSALLFGIYAIIMQIIILEKKTKVLGFIWIIAAILNFGLNLVLIPYIGIIGAALTTLISFAFGLIATIYYSSSYFPEGLSSDMRKSIPRTIFASLWMIPIVVVLQPIGIILIILAICLCAAVYFAILITLKGITKEEILFFSNCLPGLGR